MTTLRELAAEAGVSVATASRAFSRPDVVEEGTRERILDAARRLHYSPNRAAQALITGRTQTIGLVVPDLGNPFHSGVVKGAQQAARRAGQDLLLGDTEEDPETETKLALRLAQRTDALVLCSSRMSLADLAMVRERSEVVLVNRQVEGVPAVTFDTRLGVGEVVAHLRALGHLRIAYVGGPERSYSSAERRGILGEASRDAGLEVVDLGHHDPGFEGGRRAADRLLIAGVTAVVVYNDLMALGLIARLLEYGVRVPQDMSVVGWDDIEFSAMFTPALTTVHMPRVAAGRAAVEFLLGRLAGGDAEPARLDTSLVFRATTARPAQTATSASDRTGTTGPHTAPHTAVPPKN